MQAIIYLRTELGKALKLLKVGAMHGVKFATATTGGLESPGGRSKT